jgi:DNA polymerase delta subunit 3
VQKAGKVQEVEQAKPPAKKEPLTKPKPTGKLDFSKAKTKEEKKAEAKESSVAKLPQNGKKPEASASSSKMKAETVADKVPKKEEPKVGATLSPHTFLLIGPYQRGVKRKSVGLLPSDTESNTDSTTSRVKPKSVEKSSTRPRVHHSHFPFSVCL